MKRVVSSFLIAAMLAAACAGLCACNQDADAGEPFLGVASEQTFETAEKAAEAFFTGEVCGENDGTEFVKYEKKRELNEAQISELALSEKDRADLVSAEEGEIIYLLGKEQTVSLVASEDESEEYRQKMFLLYFKEHCKYYVPPVETGERLTKSYYISLFNPDKYKNCTLTCERSSLEYGILDKMLVQYDGEILMIAWDELTFWLPYGTGLVVLEQLSPDTPYKLDYWEEGTLSDVFTVLLGKYSMLFDYSKLVKTANGFVSVEGYNDEYGGVGNISAEVESNRIKLITRNWEDRDRTEQIAFTDFGTTKVEIPKDVQQMYDDYVKEHAAGE